MENRTILFRGLVCLAVAAMPSCGSGGGGSVTTPPVTTPPLPDRAVVSITNSPDPIIAEKSTDPDYPWLVRWTTTFHESAGLGGNVDFIHVNFRTPQGGEPRSVLNYGATDIKERAGTNDFAARGDLAVPLGMLYRTASGARSITVLIVAQAHDQRGNLITLESQVRAVFNGVAWRVE